MLKALWIEGPAGVMGLSISRPVTAGDGVLDRHMAASRARGPCPYKMIGEVRKITTTTTHVDRL